MSALDLVDSSARLALLSDLIGVADDQGHADIARWLEGTMRAHRDSVAAMLREAAVSIARGPDDKMACAFARAKSVLGIVDERHRGM